MAFTVTVAGDGAVAGEVYSPVAEIVPTVLPPPVMLLTCQVTEVFVLPVTVAANCTLAPVGKETDVGSIEIPALA